MWERIRARSDSINDSARMARTSLSLLLLVALYIVLILFSASDENLLRNVIVVLPNLKTGISIEISYILAPPIFFFLHLQVLFLLRVVAQKVEHFENALEFGLPRVTDMEKAECRDWLSAFSFVQSFHRESKLVRAAKILTLFGTNVIPLFLFLLIDISFVRYQSFFITSSHHVWLLVDLIAVWRFNQGVFTSTLPIQWKSLRNLFLSGTKQWNSGKKSLVLAIPRIVTLNRVMVSSMAGVIIAVLLVFIRPSEFDTNCLYKTWDTEPRNATQIIRALIADGDFLSVILWYQSMWARLNLDSTDQLLTRTGASSDIDSVPREVDEEIRSNYQRRHGINLSERSLRYAKFQSTELLGARLENTDLRGADLRTANLSVANLRNAEMNCANLSEAKLTDAELHGAILTGANLSKAKLNRALLNGATLDGTIMSKAILNQADLSDAKLNGVIMSQAELVDAILVRADLSCLEIGWDEIICADLTDADFTGADLTDADLTGANLLGATLTDTNLSTAMLNHTILSDADLNGLNLHQAKLTDADLRGAKLTDADLTGTDLRGTNLDKADLHGADLRGADLTGADLTDADFTGADLRGAKLSCLEIGWDEIICTDLRGADLRGADLSCLEIGWDEIICADLRGADLRGADLRGAKLTNTDFTGSDLRGADLRRTNLDKADFTGADLRGTKLTGANLHDVKLSDR